MTEFAHEPAVALAIEMPLGDVDHCAQQARAAVRRTRWGAHEVRCGGARRDRSARSRSARPCPYASALSFAARISRDASAPSTSSSLRPSKSSGGRPKSPRLTHSKRRSLSCVKTTMRAAASASSSRSFTRSSSSRLTPDRAAGSRCGRARASAPRRSRGPASRNRDPERQRKNKRRSHEADQCDLQLRARRLGALARGAQIIARDGLRQPSRRPRAIAATLTCRGGLRQPGSIARCTSASSSRGGGQHAIGAPSDAPEPAARRRAAAARCVAALLREWRWRARACRSRWSRPRPAATARRRSASGPRPRRARAPAAPTRTSAWRPSLQMLKAPTSTAATKQQRRRRQTASLTPGRCGLYPRNRFQPPHARPRQQDLTERRVAAGFPRRAARRAARQSAAPLRAFSSKKSAWLASADTSEGWKGLVMR